LQISETAYNYICMKYTEPILYTEEGAEIPGYESVSNGSAEYTLWYDPKQVSEDTVWEIWDRFHEEEGDIDWFWDEVHNIDVTASQALQDSLKSKEGKEDAEAFSALMRKGMETPVNDVDRIVQEVFDEIDAEGEEEDSQNS